MHGLDIIAKKNAAAAGRECGEAVNAHDYAKADKIQSAQDSTERNKAEWKAYSEAYFAERNLIQGGPDRGPRYH